ncbi:MAG: helix-turn-helix domain-containing protein [Anaerolineae bacterium]|nr:helix-turn-helix domain-containing protein [Anaerolineae bacterium]
MSDLGQWLREAREARGLSLAEVEEATRIRQYYLSALESDDWAALPSETVGRGFLRNYALFLGLNAEELLTRRQEECGESDQSLADVSPSRPVDYRPIEFDLKIEDEPGSSSRLRWIVMGVIVAALLIAAGWAITRYPYSLTSWIPHAATTPTAPAPASPTARPTFTPTHASTPTEPATTPTVGVFLLPTPTPTPTSIPTHTPTPVPIKPTHKDEIRIVTRITERAWLRVVVDGQVALETILEPGDEREWVGKRSVTVRSGNAGGVEILIDGQDLGTMGEPGQVVERTWTWEEGRVVELAPTVATEEKPAAGGGVEPIITSTPIPTPTPAG